MIRLGMEFIWSLRIKNDDDDDDDICLKELNIALNFILIKK